MQIVNLKSSFVPINLHPVEIANLDLLETECKRICTTTEPVDISPIDKEFLNMPYFLRIFLSIYNILASRAQSRNNPSCDQLTLLPVFNSNLKHSLMRHIGTIIQKKLFSSAQFQKIYEEVSYSLAFKPTLLPYFISLLSENTNFVPIQKLTSFYRTICSEQFILYIPIQLYYLYGGSLFNIEAKIFKEKATNLIEVLGKVLANSETIINRNIQQFKTNKQRKMILDESLKAVMLCKNKESLQQIIQKITSNIFNGREYLNKDEFLYQIQSKPLDPLLSIFILFLRSEYIMIEEKAFQNLLATRSEIVSTNFYATEMNKLLNKCPFNGDQRCNCKKCQCIRRNRESAKLNQEKKRNAVQQVQVLKKRIEQLEANDKKYQKQVSELRQENMMLKTLLKQIRHNPSIKSIMMEAIEPINKVLNNDL